MAQVHAFSPVQVQQFTKNFGEAQLGAENPTRTFYVGVPFSSGVSARIASATLGGTVGTIVPNGAIGAEFVMFSKPTGLTGDLIITFTDGNVYAAAPVIWRYINGSATPTHSGANAYSFANHPRSVAAITPGNGFSLAIAYSENTADTATVTNATKGTQLTANAITGVSAIRSGASSADIIFNGLGSNANAQASVSVGP
jgi:hypothetical protein